MPQQQQPTKIMRHIGTQPLPATQHEIKNRLFGDVLLPYLALFCTGLCSALLCFGLTWPVACFLHNTKSITILIKYSKPEDEKERAENEDAEGGGKGGKRTQSAKCPLRRFTGNSSRSNSVGEAQIGKSDELKGNAIKQLQPSKDFNNAIKYPNIAAHGVAKLICSKNP